MCRMLFTAEKILKFRWNDAWKKIHDDDAFRHVTWRHAMFQYEHHTIYFNSILFSVSEKETNFSILHPTTNKWVNEVT